MKITGKKKIIISSYDDQKNPVYSGGGAYSIHQLAKRLAKKYEVSVLTGTYKNAENETIDKIKYTRIGSDVFGHKIGQLLYQYSLLKYARKNNYDVWIEGSTPPFTFSLLPLFIKKPLISWIHMICSYDMQRKYFINIRLIEKSLCKLYKYFIVPTAWVQNEIKSMNAQALTKIIPNGYDQSTIFLSKKPLNNQKYLLFMGRIEIDQKGLDLLIKALTFSKETTRVIIAGSGSLKEEKKLRDLINLYKIQNKIQLLKRVQGNKKEELFSQAIGVIIPSRYETFVTVALESIMYQKPIICFDIPQNEWVPEKFSFKIKPFNILDLSAAINNMYTQKIIKKITLNDKETYMKKYSWKNFLDKFEDYLKEIAI